jgi:hypothetical protein
MKFNNKIGCSYPGMQFDTQLKIREESSRTPGYKSVIQFINILHFFDNRGEYIYLVVLKVQFFTNFYTHDLIRYVQ